MKRMKKIMALMLAAIMMMAMSVTAFAAEGAAGTHTLTVNVNSTTPAQDLKGQTINLYKLFDVTESKSGETTNYAYTVNNTYKAALASVLNISETSTDEEFAKAVADKTATIQQFANDFTAKALTDNLGATKTSGKITESNTSYEFTGLDAGYYLVYVTGGKEIQSSLVTVDATTNTVNLKTEAPSITKTANKETAEIGQVVTYTVTGVIPDTTGYSEYVYKIHDELTKGLDFVNDANGTALEAGATTVNVKVAFKEAGVTDAKKKKKKITIKDIIRLIVLLVAFSVLLYPTFSSYLNEKNSSKVVSYYDEESVKLSKAEKEQMLEDARAYNKEMLENIDLIDPFSQEDVEIDARYESLLNVDGSGMMGYIRIPKINVELPIYHGTSEAVLQAGVGHFWGTSLPVGGESTHTVLTGHRGLPTKTLFTNMDKLEVGDIFYIKVLDETLAYQIDQILTVLPQETDSLSIEPGKDYATLVTCTPFAINTHRLLVRGERIPYEEATKQEPDTNIKPELSFTAKVLIVTIIVIFIGLMIAVIYSIRDRKRRKARCERR